MKKISVIAQNTFKELLRNRVLYSFLMFAIFLLLMMIALGQLSYTEQYRLTLSMGLSSIHLCLMGLTIFIGGSVVYREIDRLTILTLLARSISRTEFLLGKYFGFLRLMILFIAGFFILYYANMLIMGFSVSARDLLIVFLGYTCEVMVLLAVTIFFSTFCASFLTIIFSLGFFAIAHWAVSLTTMVTENDQNRQFMRVAHAVQTVLPNLEKFNWRLYPLEHGITGQTVGMAVVSAVCWAVFFLLAASLIFRNRDFA